MTLKTDDVILNDLRNVHLTVMTQSLGGEFAGITQRPGVLILPGGGYAMCSDREAEVIAFPYLNHGYHAFVLRYSVAEHNIWPNPLDDYEQAMEYLTAHSEEWGLMMDKIAVIGFSAGGHLAACAATMGVHRPAAAILCYAALAQEIAEACQPGSGIPSPIDYVDGDTCPCFLAMARDDQIVPLDGMLDFQKAMVQAGVRFESHVYAYGDHGFGPGDPSVAGTKLCLRASNWMRDSISWLDDTLGKMNANGLGEPACSPRLNGDWEETLNILCTLRHLRTQQQAYSVLQESFAFLDAIIQGFGGMDLAKNIYERFSLQTLMTIQGKTPEDITAMDKLLKAIPNVRKRRTEHEAHQ